MNHRQSLKYWQPRYHSDLSCPICLQTAALPVETNCGHLFCGSCLMAYWKHGSWLGAVSCPLCRQKVSGLRTLFCEHQQDKQSRGIVDSILDYNRRFSGQPRPFTDYLYDLPLLLHLAFRAIFTMGALVWIFCLRILLCAFGAIMRLPFDVVSEPLCGVLGMVDDLVVIFLLLLCMLNICQQIDSGAVDMPHSTTQSVLAES
ncbi:E3 ubiquitin-protein ligase RNF170-like [Ambystoma mexicanum]|uniref:E3 ubiquitin-protein ligase RNF170-like n=1 Tax=Ambystoma mexicanum TaxID=8296 RepID=UPI0037E81AD2